MKELYLANMWPQVVTKRGIKLFEQNGFEVSGNWLNGNTNFPKADKIIMPYANFGNPVLITEGTSRLWKKVTSYILFPDSGVGWNFGKKRYLFRKNADAERILLKSSKKLSHSNFSSQIINKTYGDTHNISVPLGVDTISIKNCKRNKHPRLRVLWNHMWRSDKGVWEAFDLISNLAPRYPKVEFWIGQNDTWDMRDSITFKKQCEYKLNALKLLNNVKIFNRIKDQKEYWSWLKQIDIGFSTAFQEGFGLSMMEQEAAGIACIVPNAEVYPELHSGCLIVDRQKLSESLQTVIENPIKRKFISQSCIENASSYDTSIWVKALVAQLE